MIKTKPENKRSLPVRPGPSPSCTCNAAWRLQDVARRLLRTTSDEQRSDGKQPGELEHFHQTGCARLEFLREGFTRSDGLTRVIKLSLKKDGNQTNPEKGQTQ